jgi:quercetin dioxygenase-like cupin family protein
LRGVATRKPTVIPLADLQLSVTAARFEGRDHGAQTSFFVTDHPPGANVPLHRHPYEEVFIVREGAATFSLDGETVEAEAGNVVIVPAGAAHGFANKADGALRMVSIHPNDHVVQEWLED